MSTSPDKLLATSAPISSNLMPPPSGVGALGGLDHRRLSTVSSNFSGISEFLPKDTYMPSTASPSKPTTAVSFSTAVDSNGLQNSTSSSSSGSRLDTANTNTTTEATTTNPSTADTTNSSSTAASTSKKRKGKKGSTSSKRKGSKSRGSSRKSTAGGSKSSGGFVTKLLKRVLNGKSNTEKGELTLDALDEGVLKERLKKLDEELDEYKARCARFKLENEWYTREIESCHTDTADYIAYLEAKKAEKLGAIGQIVERNQKELESFIERKKLKEADNKQKIKELQETIVDLQLKLDTKAEEISHLSDIMQQRAKHEAEVIKIREEIRAAETAHRDKVSQIEHKLLETRLRLQREAEARIRNMENAAQEKAAKYMNAHLSDLATSNASLSAQLRTLMQTTQSQLALKDSLEQQNTILARELRVREDVLALRLRKVKEAEDKRKHVLIEERKKRREAKKIVVKEVMRRCGMLMKEEEERAVAGVADEQEVKAAERGEGSARSRLPDVGENGDEGEANNGDAREAEDEEEKVKDTPVGSATNVSANLKNGRTSVNQPRSRQRSLSQSAGSGRPPTTGEDRSAATPQRQKRASIAVPSSSRSHRLSVHSNTPDRPITPGTDGNAPASMPSQTHTRRVSVNSAASSLSHRKPSTPAAQSHRASLSVPPPPLPSGSQRPSMQYPSSPASGRASVILSTSARPSTAGIPTLPDQSTTTTQTQQRGSLFGPNLLTPQRKRSDSLSGRQHRKRTTVQPITEAEFERIWKAGDEEEGGDDDVDVGDEDVEEQWDFESMARGIGVVEEEVSATGVVTVGV
ncbi:hypothetical protein HK102_006833 [Quaeritorhiza haematococci]|nr:hypothetical protein HK102_006833 [Quaeritorhiza haematococci]